MEFVYFQYNAFENVVCEMAANLSRPQYVKGADIFIWHLWLSFSAVSVTSPDGLIASDCGQIWPCSVLHLEYARNRPTLYLPLSWAPFQYKVILSSYYEDETYGHETVLSLHFYIKIFYYHILLRRYFGTPPSSIWRHIICENDKRIIYYV